MEAVRQEPQIQINVIDTDFLSISRPYQICMQLMGISVDPTEGSDAVGVWLTRLVIAAFCAVLSVWAYGRCQSPTGYQRHTS